jgi:hypothetical protein
MEHRGLAIVVAGHHGRAARGVGSSSRPALGAGDMVMTGATKRV